MLEARNKENGTLDLLSLGRRGGGGGELEVRADIGQW